MGKRGTWTLLLTAFVLVGIAHVNSLQSGFHFDDGHSIQDNVYLQSLAHVGSYFTDVSTFSPLAENRSYRPILLVSYAVSYALGDGAPWAFHLLTLLLHVLGAFLVGELAFSIFKSRWAAYFATALFAVHPLLTESVSYISARSSLMGAVLLFCTVRLYIYARGSKERELRWLLVANAVLLLALGTKLLAITVVALLIAWEVLLGPARDRLGHDSPRQWLIRLAPPALISFVFAVFHEWIIGDTARASRSTITPVSHLLTQTRVWQRYQGLFIWPEDLCADLVMRWSEVPWEGETARAILWALLVAAIAWAMRRRQPALSFAIVWFYVTLSPTNSFIPLSEPATEHRVYVAAPGLVWATIAVVSMVFGRRLEQPIYRRGLAVAAAIVIGAFTLTTIQRNRVWLNDETLWSDVIQCAPTNGRAHLNYGRALFGRGDYDGARLAYEACRKHWPAYAFCDINLVVLDLRENALDLAERDIALAEAHAPDNVYTHVWRGETDLAAQRFGDAEAAFARALVIAPNLTAAVRGQAQARFELGRIDEARAPLTMLADQNQLYAPGWYALGFIAESDGQTAMAMQHYQRALRIDPKESRARYNLARLLHGQNRLPEAIGHYLELERHGTLMPDALFNLALALAATNQLTEARHAKTRLQSIAPGYPRLNELKF